ncbi:MAG: Kelch repeat-containing protein [Promethearchaeota archaeon]
MRKFFVLWLIVTCTFSFHYSQEKALCLIMTSGLKWVEGSPLVINETGHAYVYNDKIYFVGQYSVQEYDPERGNWIRIKETGLGYRSYRGGSALIGDKIYIIHGWSGEKSKIYDITKDSISTFTRPPTNRLDVAVAAVNDILYVSGGWLSGTSMAITKVEAYNPKNDTWWTVSPMGTSRRMHEMVGIGGYLYVIGGYTGWGFINVTTSVERYNPLTDEWEYMKANDYEYHQCGSTTKGDDQIIVSNVTHTSIFDVSKNTWNSWESLLYEDIIPVNPDYKGGFFANSLVCLDQTVFSIGLRDAPGNYYAYVWTLDLAQSINNDEITSGYNIFFLLLGITIVTISVKKGRKKFY